MMRCLTMGRGDPMKRKDLRTVIIFLVWSAILIITELKDQGDEA